MFHTHRTVPANRGQAKGYSGWGSAVAPLSRAPTAKTERPLRAKALTHPTAVLRHNDGVGDAVNPRPCSIEVGQRRALEVRAMNISEAAKLSALVPYKAPNGRGSLAAETVAHPKMLQCITTTLARLCLALASGGS